MPQIAQLKPQCLSLQDLQCSQVRVSICSAVVPGKGPIALGTQKSVRGQQQVCLWNQVLPDPCSYAATQQVGGLEQRRMERWTERSRVCVEIALSMVNE